MLIPCGLLLFVVASRLLTSLFLKSLIGVPHLDTVWPYGNDIQHAIMVSSLYSIRPLIMVNSRDRDSCISDLASGSCYCSGDCCLTKEAPL